MKKELSFYPEIEPYKKEFFQVSELHTLYLEQSGNPQGEPVIVLHGGPGGGVYPDLRRFFDPEHYRIIMFDQRGAGLSKPAAELQENTTWDLVNDIEKIRKHLNVQSWIIFGGSWGSTLALAYSQTHPKNVVGLILRGIFLCRPSEIHWFYQQGASEIFPDLWEKYKNHIPIEERNNFVEAYYKRLTDINYETRVTAAKIWSQWEASTAKLIFDPASVDEFEEDQYALQFARIESHYFINNAFFKTDNWLLENINLIKDIPCSIVQGRYDIVCPMKSAWDLHLTWPSANLKIIPDAGHSAMESGIKTTLIDFCNDFKKYKRLK